MNLKRIVIISIIAIILFIGSFYVYKIINFSIDINEKDIENILNSDNPETKRNIQILLNESLKQIVNLNKDTISLDSNPYNNSL